MYEHPYLAYTVTEYEQEHIQRAAERRRFLAEHADQIVPRAAGPVRRLGERMLRAIIGARAAAPDAAAPADRRADVPADRQAAASADRDAALRCEPVAAR